MRSLLQLGVMVMLLSTDEIALSEKIRCTLALYEPKHLNARDQSSWDVMHSLIAFGRARRFIATALVEPP